MCEILTIVATLVFASLYFYKKRRQKSANAELTTALMFLGASLMWCVDCIANKLEGEPFFDLSREDSILGLIVVGAGLIVYLFLRIHLPRIPTNH